MRQKPTSQSQSPLTPQALEEWAQAMAEAKVKPYPCSATEIPMREAISLPRSQQPALHVFSPNSSVSSIHRASQALPALRQGAREGIHAALHRNLKRGQLSIDAVLDLHGQSQRASYDALCVQLQRSHQLGHRLLLVITGKGHIATGGILRQALPKWLNDEAIRPYVIAYEIARQKDGGAGAYYVLLRKGSRHS